MRLSKIGRPPTNSVTAAGEPLTVAALPRTPTGKILKRELRKPFWVGQERQVH